MPGIEISSPRTLVRPFEPGDAPELFACISPEITRFMAWEPPRTPDAFEEVWRNWIPSIEDLSDLHLVARDRKDGRCLGIVGVHALQSRKPELGIWLRRDVHGQGYGRELVGSVAAWASNHFPVRYFEYPVAEENVASRRIAEAFGGRIAERRTNPKYRSVVYHIPPVADASL
ncbi:MAG: N-acetyltransferase [Mesorhizobium sp.]|uniref:GNAT family N-acetyltransferase n=1 Tax=Mesorhizobium sp. TaxID=1871066 RepID=UPI000FEA0C5C|nr:GNAT family N-acetyltransferase [Mesorhizobium sp.]RWM12878.1 MAG: N-acetyltransferase [Mesorhizobium sp.]